MKRLHTCLTAALVVLAATGVQTAAAGDTGQRAARVDFNGDRIVNFLDFARLAQSWRSADASVDIAPAGGDGIVDGNDLTVLTGYWLQTIPAPILITWIGHASVRIAWEDKVVYVDPRKIAGTPQDATLILVTHSHSDHYSPADIAKVVQPGTRFVGPADVVKAYGSGQVILPGQTLEVAGLSVRGVAAYNLVTSNHPKANNWLGLVVQFGARRIYVAGDTDLTPEMKALTNLDVAFLPAGGTYTFDAAGAAEATKYLKPLLAIPYHWGEIVGTLADAQRFAKLAACNVKVMAKGETLSSDDWQKDFSVAAWWKMDETQGTIADDSAGGFDGTLAGGPLWQPAGGKVGGALQLDGMDDFIKTPFVLNPAEGTFSLFAWVKGGGPGQAIVSQIGGANWLMADSATGALLTQLRASGRSSKDLISAQAVADGQWHRVGLTWDGASRVLYVDDVEVARDSQGTPVFSTGGFYLGAGGTLASGSFWSGLMDDVRLYSRAVTP
ncbi:MAG: MBL fold metallo-hydrolase [Planctomycetes bacterium]|nr:MBL fold metallo-hydrolase [Planctomycetota bacterium]